VLTAGVKMSNAVLRFVGPHGLTGGCGGGSGDVCLHALHDGNSHLQEEMFIFPCSVSGGH
jgi:hypothetical protein